MDGPAIKDMLDAAGLLRDAELFDTTPDEIADRRMGEPIPFVSTCGGGLNSTAGLVLLAARGDRPDAILFADTGGEKPETYEHVGILSAWCESIGFPPVTTVRNYSDPARQKHADKYTNLEEECRVKKALPSIAYFNRGCSDKWKIRPQEMWVKKWPPALEAWATGGRVAKAIYYDANEGYRATIFRDDRFVYWFPLLSVGWGRIECEVAIRAAGLPVPPKSSCFFCPEMTPAEIFDLSPDLLNRALAMEANANLTSIKGLGKHDYSWAELVAGRVPLAMVEKANTGIGRVPCVCNENEGV